MSPIEHYFENLLTMDSDIKGEPNKNALSKEVQEAIEICADYIKNIQLYSNAIPNDSKADAEYKDPINTIDYRRAFKIACDLLNGDILYGVDTDKIFELMMQKDEVVSSSSYEEYILNHLQELDQGQYATENCIACKYDETEEEDGEHCKKCLAGDSQFELDKEFIEPTTKNDLVVDFISGERIRVALPEQELSPQPRCKECKWWKDSDGIYRRGCGAESQCPINRKEVYQGEGYCYMFSPKADMKKEE